MHFSQKALVTSNAGKVLLAAAVLSATLFLPYLVPVPPSLSLSYVTQFSNRAASLLFIAGALLFAWLTRGQIAQADGTLRDRKLSIASLLIALVYTVVLLWADLFDTAVHRAGSEFYYNINRVMMLIGGLRPYRDFEYAYGPLHLYVPWLAWRITHWPILSYYAWWSFEWIAGTAMIWCIVRWMPFQQRWREFIFWGFLLLRSLDLWNEGLAYTPFRTMGAAFWILAVHTVWKRNQSSWRTALTGIVAVAFSMGIAPEQAVGVAAGLLVWFAILLWKVPGQFQRTPAVVFLVATAVLFAGCGAAGMFTTLLIFSKGAYSFPLAVSVLGLLILLTYLAAPCAALQQFLQRDFTSAALPLAAGGLAMIPSAFGRCDFGHLQFASPAMVCGIAWIQTRSTLRHMWTAAVLCAAIVPTLASQVQFVPSRVAQAIHTHSRRDRTHASPAATATTAAAQPATQGQDSAPAIRLAAPCTEIYRSPVLFPQSGQTPAQACMETGYFMGLINAFDEASLQRKIRELDQTPRKPIVLPDVPFSTSMPQAEADPKFLLEVESALWLPPARRAPFSYGSLQRYILDAYTPDPKGSNGFRIWRPKTIN
ncbi:hypothetical protein [Terriglobus aquaticus]|uniref:Uncharacterized protein n=1 Tax=Terriglobus aquaticus TaxID=940139 RepID=A0ABW9KHP4_9BACT|nr:hypothetical protein [Terriglobus aquaticus]